MLRLSMSICTYVHMYACSEKCTNTQAYVCLVTQYLNNFPKIWTSQLHNTPKKSCKIKYMENFKPFIFVNWILTNEKNEECYPLLQPNVKLDFKLGPKPVFEFHRPVLVWFRRILITCIVAFSYTTYQHCFKKWASFCFNFICEVCPFIWFNFQNKLLCSHRCHLSKHTLFIFYTAEVCHLLKTNWLNLTSLCYMPSSLTIQCH